jgi:hypothetical protein
MRRRPALRMLACSVNPDSTGLYACVTVRSPSVGEYTSADSTAFHPVPNCEKILARSAVVITPRLLADNDQKTQRTTLVCFGYTS